MWFSPSVIATSRANTFLVRGRRPHPPLRGTFPNGEERVTTAHSWLHLMGELSKPQVLTEGEKLIDRCTDTVFLP